MPDSKTLIRKRYYERHRDRIRVRENRRRYPKLVEQHLRDLTPNEVCEIRDLEGIKPAVQVAEEFNIEVWRVKELWGPI